jgi:hypothetical protein
MAGCAEITVTGCGNPLEPWPSCPVQRGDTTFRSAFAGASPKEGARRVLEKHQREPSGSLCTCLPLANLQVATVTSQGRPSVRTMVFRGFVGESSGKGTGLTQAMVVTHARSTKIAQLEAGGAVSALA